jgi:hypothetical protein
VVPHVIGWASGGLLHDLQGGQRWWIRSQNSLSLLLELQKTIMRIQASEL